MDTRTVCQMQSFIESKMEEPNGNILDDNFIANFRLLKVTFFVNFSIYQ